jgi:hypothetical protein
MNPNIRSSEFAWARAELKLFSRVIKGIRGFEFKKTVEKEFLFGAGPDPLDIQEGNRKVEGNIKILGFELDQLNTTANMAGFQDITEVPHEAINITLSLKKTAFDKTTTITIRGIAFTEYAHAMEQNAKMREVTLPILAMDMFSVTV